jgi:hypothetical protein
MKADFSEFSYGFALTSELVDRYGVRSAASPIFPSLYQEGKSGGYDVEIPGIAWFLQFKLSDCMVRGTAKECNQGFVVPYYRFPIRPLRHSKQHDLLRALEKTGRKVFYCAPTFHQSLELNSAFANRTVEAQTVFVAPSSIGKLPDKYDHNVVFKSVATNWKFCSKPKGLRHASGEEIFGSSRGGKFAAGTQSSNDFFTNIANELIQIYERIAMPQFKPHQDQPVSDISFLRQIGTRSNPPEFAGIVSYILFGCQLLVRSTPP